MRAALLFFAPVTVCAIVLSGCGYAGEPRPPSLKRPMRVVNLAANERGSKIVVSFRLPKETTEGIPIDTQPEIELRAGVVPPGEWNLNEWETHSTIAPVMPLQIPPGGLEPEGRAFQGRATHAPRAYSGGAAPAPISTKRLRSIRAKATYPPIAPSYFERTVSIDAEPFVNKTIAIGVRVRGPHGHDDGWSLINLPVLPVLAAPAHVRVADARGAVHLEWDANSAATGFHIYRKLPDDSDWLPLGDAAQAVFDDPAPALGKPAQYYVEAFHAAGAITQLSDRSAPVSITAADRFPPAVPAGLTAISGAKSIELVWDRVEDGDLAGYRVYRDGKRIADALISPVYSDADVAAGVKYRYEVSAVDQTGNESTRSAGVEVTKE